MVACRSNWGEDRVYFHDEHGRLCSMPARWTDRAPVDPFLVAAGGRSNFTVEDLLELTRVLRALEGA